jgi:RHS repeat-associated protein
VVKTSASRVVLQRREYEPYGKQLTPALESGPGFTGHDTDPDTQYTYMQQRYYDPRVARFWSVDPVTVSNVGGNFNRYWYGNGNPFGMVDPDGRQACSDECMKMRATTDGGLARGLATKEFASFLRNANQISGNYRFDSAAKSAKFFDQVARNGRNLGWEVGANIMEGMGGFYAADFHTDFNPGRVDAITPSSDDQWFAIIHTHPGTQSFSGAADYWNRQTGFQGSIAYQFGSVSGGTDIASAQLNQVNAMVTLSNGNIWMWDYGRFNAAVNSSAAWTVYVKDYFQQVR